jgi:hypothetical protein
MEYTLQQLCMMTNSINMKDIEGLTHIINPRELCYSRLDGMKKNGKLFDYLMRYPVFRKNDVVYYPELTLTNHEKYYIVNNLINFKELFLEKINRLIHNKQFDELHSIICPKDFIIGFMHHVWLSRYDQFYETDSELDYIIDVVKLYNHISDEENNIIYSCNIEYDSSVKNTDNKGVIFFFSGIDFSENDNFSIFLSDNHIDYHINDNESEIEFECLKDFSRYKQIKL